MAGKVSAAEGALKQGADTVAAGRVELDQKIKELRGKLDNIGGSWQGQAAVAFNALMLRWTEDTNKIIAALTNFEDDLNRAQAGYTQTEEEQQQVFNRMQGLLG